MGLPSTTSCHVCDLPIEGEPAGHGTFMFFRGDHAQTEEPPLCERCAVALYAQATLGWAEDEDEG